MRVRAVAVLHQGQEGAVAPTIINALQLRDNVCRAVCDLGLEAEPVYLDTEFKWVEKILKLRPDLIFNAADLGFFYDIKLEPNIAAVLDGIGLPYTGSSSYSAYFTGDKYASKIYLQSLGAVPVPTCYLLKEIDVQKVELPLIIKHRYGHNSEGLSEKSVVYDRAQLELLVAAAQTSPVEQIAEEYIDGAEAAAGFIGNQTRLVLPHFNVEYGDAFANRPKILDYSAKWHADAASYQNSATMPARYSKALTGKITKYLLRVADYFKMTDYGRCDFRIKKLPDGSEEAYVIDINTNPDINKEAGLCRMAEAIGLNYAEFIGKLIQAAVERYEQLDFRAADHSKGAAG